MEFDFVIEYKQGSENVAADALSRVEYAALVSHAPLGVIREEMPLIRESKLWYIGRVYLRMLRDLFINVLPASNVNMRMLPLLGCYNPSLSRI